MRIFASIFVIATLMWAAPAQARSVSWTKKMLEAFLNGAMSNASMRFHKKWVKYRFPGLGLNGKSRLQAVYLNGKKVKLQFYKLKVKTIKFDLSAFPQVKIKVRFKRARPAIKGEYRLGGKMVDAFFPDIHWLSPRLEATTRLQVSNGKLALSSAQFRFYGSLTTIITKLMKKKVSFATVQRRIKPHICRYVDRWMQGTTKRKIDERLNTELRRLCGGKTPYNIRLTGGKLRAECR